MSKLLHLGSSRPASVPPFLGGCYVLRELARRTIGPVCLARQLAFNRFVALEVMRPTWAGNPIFAARFTRKAYAAAQLANPHIAAIHGFGQERGADLFHHGIRRRPNARIARRDRTPLEPLKAGAYVLQAARGLTMRTTRTCFTAT